MLDTLTEEEQIIALKAWWKKYGVYIVGGIFAGILFYFGWSFWQSKDEGSRAMASLHYQNSVEALLKGDEATAKKLIDAQKFAELPMPYAYMEKLLTAELAIRDKKWDEANSLLQQAQVMGTDAFFRELAVVRLARVMLEQGKAQVALDLLETQSDLTNAQIWIVRGDTYRQLNEIANARDAYTKAWDALPMLSPARQWVAMMLADLSGE